MCVAGKQCWHASLSRTLDFFNHHYMDFLFNLDLLQGCVSFTVIQLLTYTTFQKCRTSNSSSRLDGLLKHGLTSSFLYCLMLNYLSP